MNEEQAIEVISLLKDIKKLLGDISRSLPINTYDLGDVCSGLDEVKEAIENLRKEK